MPRPHCKRNIHGKPRACVFKPAGIPMSEIETVTLALDEFEAIRLADLGSMYQEQAAQEMGVSRPTFGRIVESAHKKIADALVHGKALQIEGGIVSAGEFRCCRLHDEEDKK